MKSFLPIVLPHVKKVLKITFTCNKNDDMPASCKAVKAKSCLRRNIFSGPDVEEGPKNYPEIGG